jgi:chemotaxis protein methyltransferase WspC
MNLAPVVELLGRRIGVDPTALAGSSLPKFVAARLDALGLKDPAVYAARLEKSADDFEELLDQVLVAETWFFRGGHALFAHLAGRVRDRADALGRPCRLLSIPSSTGEEPYSLAIALTALGVPGERFRLVAIDLSRRHLERAARASYGATAVRQTDAVYRLRYFTAADAGWQLAPAVRALVHFRQGNALDGHLLTAEEPFDLILCRNLLIYLHADARRQVLTTLERSLAPGGWLCVGHAEPMLLLDRHFRAVGPAAYFLFEKAMAPEESRPLPAAVALAPVLRPAPALPPPPPAFAPAAAAPRPSEPDPLAQARRLADAGNLSDALASCQAHLARAGPSAALFSLLGVIHQARHADADAADSFQKALYLQPDHVEALTHLMLLYEAGGQSAAAERLRHRLRRGPSGGAT